MSKINVCTLYSGSGGNATLIKCGEHSILIDAGKSARALERALNAAGSGIRNIGAIFITHEHTDHISALETVAKKYHIPVHMTSPTATRAVHPASALSTVVREHPPLYSERVGELEISSFITPHDSAMCVGYRIESDDDVAGVATDIGHMTDEIITSLSGCRNVVLESNHDVDMLKNGAYPYSLKQRILSPRGHLSNNDCAACAVTLARRGTENMILAHISEENNRPELALKVTSSASEEAHTSLRLSAAAADAVTYMEQDPLC